MCYINKKYVTYYYTKTYISNIERLKTIDVKITCNKIPRSTNYIISTNDKLKILVCIRLRLAGWEDKNVTKSYKIIPVILKWKR